MPPLSPHGSPVAAGVNEPRFSGIAFTTAAVAGLFAGAADLFLSAFGAFSFSAPPAC